MERTFNLLDEPWLRVVYPDCREDMVSLKDLFIHAHEYADLSGELPAQDIAVLRFLLAVLHAVFSRRDEDGLEAPLRESSSEAYRRWKALWDMGRFPEKPIVEYLEAWRDRFYLFDPVHPFYQVPDAADAGSYSVAKLNGEMVESGNQSRLFPARTGIEKVALTYAEAARWLLYVNGFDDVALKKSPQEKEWEKFHGKKLPSADRGWLGQLGLIAAKGHTLFETLLLNLVLLDDNRKPWKGCTPVWEDDRPRKAIRAEILCEGDQAALLTLQSRRLMLRRERHIVTGFCPVAGDSIPAENAFTEQMTVWKRPKENFLPKPHDRSRRMWQDFASLTAKSEQDGNSHAPGVVGWIALLMDQGCLPDDSLISFRIVSVQYNLRIVTSKPVTDSFEDSLTFHVNLLTSLGAAWVDRIEAEVERCEKLAGIVGGLGRDLYQAENGKMTGGSKDSTKKALENAGQKAKEQFYYRIDVPFRQWLRSLDAEEIDNADEKVTQWQEIEKGIAAELGEELIGQAGFAAYQGRMVKKDEKDPGRFYSAPLAFNWFWGRLKKWEEGSA